MSPEAEMLSAASWEATMALGTAAVNGDEALLHQLAGEVPLGAVKMAMCFLAQVMAIHVRSNAILLDQTPDEVWQEFAIGLAKAINP